MGVLQLSMDSPLPVDAEFGYVVFVFIAAYLVNIWMMVNVGRMRKKLKIVYPKMYDDKEDLFNCYQRAHQNTLELLPFFLGFLLFAGFRHPRLATLFGMSYLVGRIVFAKAYYTGDPTKRIPGVAISYVSLWALILQSISFAAGMLSWW